MLENCLEILDFGYFYLWMCENTFLRGYFSISPVCLDIFELFINAPLWLSWGIKDHVTFGFLILTYDYLVSK